MQGDILAIIKNNARNLFINGDLNNWQRGTNVNALSAYGPDRFFGNSASGFFSREDGGSASALAATGFKYAVNAEQGAGGGSYAQRIESIFFEDIAIGTKLTVSYYAASANVNATGTLLQLRTPDTTDNYSSSTVIILNPGGGTDYDSGHYMGDLEDRNVKFNQYKYTFEMTADMKRGLQVGVAGDLRVNGINGWLANTYVLTGLQLTEGQAPLNFRLSGRDAVEELRLCHRYYFNKFSCFIAGYDNNAFGTGCSIPHPVTMRTTPVSAFLGVSFAGSGYNPTLVNTTDHSVNVIFSVVNSSSQLTFNYECDAEL